jgi:sugar phosphate isomerase/epimerase
MGNQNGLPQVALQLYSVREALAQDFEGVIRRLAAMGLAGVETAGQYGASPAAAKRLFDELGLKVCSSHMPLPLGEQQQQVIETVLAVGSPRIVICLGPDDFATPDKIRESCDKLNEASAIAGKHGIAIGYHNHWWEFEPRQGQEPAWRQMEGWLKPEVFWEVDTYWATVAGASAPEAVRELGSRAPLLHIKDGPGKKDQPMLAAGTGIMDFPAIAAAGGNKAEWWIIELDECATDMLEAVDASIQYLTGKGLAHGNR